MIAVDTSVWIAFFRGTSAAVTGHLRELLRRDAVALPALVKIELLGGVGRREGARLRRLLGALPRLEPSPEVWGRLESWVERAAAKGQRFGLGDLLIAATAAEGGDALWSLDGDLARMASLGFITLHDFPPPGE